MIENPFVTNGYVGPEYFCDRTEETAMLTKLLTNGNNIALISASCWENRPNAPLFPTKEHQRQLSLFSH